MMRSQIPEEPLLTPVLIKENLAVIDELRQTIRQGAGATCEPEAASSLSFRCDNWKYRRHAVYVPTSLLTECVNLIPQRDLTSLCSIVINEAYAHFIARVELDTRVVAEQMVITSAIMIHLDSAARSALLDAENRYGVSYLLSLSLEGSSGGTSGYFDVQHRLYRNQRAVSDAHESVSSPATISFPAGYGEQACRPQGVTLQ
ncbi:hypothetical protein [Litorivivens sp.]|uniref:hypothetical protein n=2 Tax=Litorivivens sp. TaxID=2020868 RepID=UPI0035629C10